MLSNDLENQSRPRPALLASGFRSPVDASGVPANMVPAEIARILGATGTGMLGEMPLPPPIPSETGTGISRPHPALSKLIANRNTNLLAMVLTRWKQRAATLSNRHKIHFVHGPVSGARKSPENSFGAAVTSLIEKRSPWVSKPVILSSLRLEWFRASRRLDGEPARPWVVCEASRGSAISPPPFSWPASG
jgi:hypothetical protein